MNAAAYLLCLCCLFVPAAQPPDTLFLDIYARETDRQLIIGNALTALTLDKQTGAWTSWTADKLDGDLLTTDPAFPALDFSINKEYQVAKLGTTLLRHSYAIDPDRRGATLSVTMGVGPQPYAYELTSTYRLFPGQKQLERTARLLRPKTAVATSGQREHFDGFRFQVPGATVGGRTDCALTVPGPFFATTFVRPETPYDSLRNRKIGFHSAPDAGFGLLILENKKAGQALASFMSTGGEVAYFTSVQGNGRTVTLRHDNARAYYLAPGQAVGSDVHHLDLSGSAAGAMRAYQRVVTATMPPDAGTPDWVKEQVILEIFPKYFKGGLKDITARLPFYKSVGFTMIYLMPHWTGGYSPLDPYELDPRFGRKEDLQQLIKTAHGLGLKVIFDMVIHGFNVKSNVPKEKPEMFVRTEADSLAHHPTWGSITPDWANPTYQQYMVDLVLHDQRTYDNDGYRVDAATYKGAGWNPNVPYPAYRDGSAAPELMTKMLAALRTHKPDAVLLSEVFGPVFYGVCNFVHDNQTEAVPLLLRKLEKGQYTADDYKKHLLGVFGSLPKGANRVFYARNHDTSWFDRFDGYTPRFMAFETVHALFGIPEAFAGDPDHPFNPDDDPATFAQYRKLFTYRKSNPAFVRGEVQLSDVASSNPQVFSGLRSLNGNRSVALVSFSDRPETATITVSAGLKSPVLTDIYTGRPLATKPAGANAFTVTLAPFQAVAGRL